MSKFAVGSILKASACFMLMVLAGCGGMSRDLVVGNLSVDGTKVSFRFANDSSGSGDVVMWIEQDGRVFCEHIVSVNPHYSYTTSFHCRPLAAGRFVLRVEWAQNYRDRALVAIRI